MTHPVEPIYCMRCGSRMEPRLAYGQERPVCPQCGHIHFDDPKVAAAVLVERQGKVLLVRRTNEPGRGKWTLPAGFVDADEDPQSAAIRECLEETGLQATRAELFDVIAGREHPRGASIVIVYRAEVEPGEPVPGDDADAVGFFPPGALPPLAFLATRRAVGRWAGRDPAML